MVCFFLCFISVLSNLPLLSIPFIFSISFEFLQYWIFHVFFHMTLYGAGLEFFNVSKESSAFCFKFKGKFVLEPLYIRAEGTTFIKNVGERKSAT